MKKKKPEDYEILVKTALLLLMFIAICFAIHGGRRRVSSVTSDEVEISKEKFCVVIDAGHGGGK